ncbi:HD-GYP domain-containing protein [Sulfuricurvum sp.]|uniref:HD-GYP domain-containing protein n=1 Tax=Sulfuricurvum sp. TaxID=2025608 RepID=UPI003BB74207
MASFEESRYIANTAIPEQVESVKEDAGSLMDTVPMLIWLLVIAALVGVIIKFVRQNRKSAENLRKNLEIIEKFSNAESGIEIEKVFQDICQIAGAEHLAMYIKKDEWYRLSFEINTVANAKNSSIPLLLSPSESHKDGLKSGNFFITHFVENKDTAVIRVYTRDHPIQQDSELYNQLQILCANGMRVHTLLSMELTSVRKSHIANITSRLSSSFLSWQYDRERFFFFISHIIMKAAHAEEVLINDEKNFRSYHYGKNNAVGIGKDFYIHHSGCRMTVVTPLPLDTVQLNTIGSFVDSSYSLFVKEEDNLKNAEEYLNFLVHSNEAMELEFPYFKHHSDMVCSVALRLAKSLQIDTKSMKNLEIAAKIHDIGMIADVSFSLGKGEKLTQEELDTIRNHPLYGSIIVEPLNQIFQISDLIKSHHERYDGQGYPLGLLADEIPLPGQILGFAEHFTGLISDRSYRPGQSFNKATEEVKKMSGQAFNPVIVRAFEQESDNIFNDLSSFKPNLTR